MYVSYYQMFQFIFAGTGPLEDEIEGIPNIKNVGFQTGKDLEKLIREARFSIYPSEWYENCPFSVMEITDVWNSSIRSEHWRNSRADSGRKNRRII